MVTANTQAERPPAIERIAPDAATFLSLLVVGCSKYVFGFPGTEFNAIRRAAGSVLGVHFVESPNPQCQRRPTREAKHGTWSSTLGPKLRARIWLCVNRCHSGELEFPQRPDCAWSLDFDVRTPFRQAMEDSMARFPFPAVRIHVPHANPDF